MNSPRDISGVQLAKALHHFNDARTWRISRYDTASRSIKAWNIESYPPIHRRAFRMLAPGNRTNSILVIHRSIDIVLGDRYKSLLSDFRSVLLRTIEILQGNGWNSGLSSPLSRFIFFQVLFSNNTRFIFIFLVYMETYVPKEMESKSKLDIGKESK